MWLRMVEDEHKDLGWTSWNEVEQQHISRQSYAPCTGAKRMSDCTRLHHNSVFIKTDYWAESGRYSVGI